MLRMLMMKVDPMAVYQAERQLHDAGITMPRQKLIDYYLLRGQLRTLVAHLKADPDHIESAYAKAIIAGPDEHINPRFVNPFLLGSCLSLIVIVLAGIKVALYFSRWKPMFIDASARWVGIVLGGVVLICYGYVYLGAAVGRRKAGNLMRWPLLGVMVLVILWVVHIAS